MAVALKVICPTKDCGETIFLEGSLRFCNKCGWKAPLGAEESQAAPVTEKPRPVIRQKPDTSSMLIGTPTDHLRGGLEILKRDAYNSFVQQVGRERARWGVADKGEDIYWEVMVDREGMPNVAKMLRHWEGYLSKLPDCQGTRGAMMTLETLAELCEAIDRERPKE